MKICIHVGAHHAEENYPGYDTVHWIEADPGQWDKLSHLNLHRFAALDFDGETVFYRRNVSMASSVLPLCPEEVDFSGRPLTITDLVTVPCRRLDTVFGDVPHVDLLVIAVEGAELLVLKGAEELLTRTEEVRIELLALPGYPTQDEYSALLHDFVFMEKCPYHGGYNSDLRYKRK